MQINLKKLKITNFKGIQNFETELEHVTDIYGDNGTGKSTIMDAFLWLFFGKNSNDASKFEIKRLDSKNNFIKNIEAEVAATLDVDGQLIIAKKVLRQKWGARRGSIEKDYTGDENVYYWNDVPLKESEFKVKIKSIVEESVFKLITNPFYFNSLNWQDRRNTLISIAGDIDNSSVLDSLITVKNKGSFGSLITALNQNKSLEEFKREIAAKKKKIKDEAESIPSRIDEVKRGMPEAIDFEDIKANIAADKNTLILIQQQIDDESALAVAENSRRTRLLTEHQNKKEAHQQKIYELKDAIRTIEFEAKQKATESDSKIAAEISSVNSRISENALEHARVKSGIFSIDRQLATKRNELLALQEEYDAIDTGINDFDETSFMNIINGLEKQIRDRNVLVERIGAEIEKITKEELSFDNVEFSCPSCGQHLPTNNIQSKKAELLANFNQDKENRLNELKNQGNSNLDEIDALDAKIVAKRNERIHYGEVFNTNKSKKLTAQVEKINDCKVEIKTLEARIDNGHTFLSNLDAEIKGLNAKLQELKQQSATPNRAVEDIMAEILSTDSKYKPLVKEQEHLQNNPIQELVFPPIISNEELKQRRAQINYNILDMEKALNSETVIEKAEARIKELQEQETALVQELSELEGIEYSIMQFTKAKIEAMEARLNGKFSMVKFKLFATQVNGGEVECCETLIDGVPFSDANNASRINAGIDIINALCNHYGVSAPIFIDNRESVVRLIESPSQIVNLIVTEGSALSVGKPKIKKAA